MAFNTEFLEKEDRIEEVEPGFSLTEFLSSPYLDTIAQTIEREYYAREVPRSHYPVILMIKLPVIKCFRKQSYVRTIHLLTEEDCFNPGAEKTEAGYLLPNPATMRESDTQSELRDPPEIQGGMKSGSYSLFSRICQNLLSRLEVLSL